MEPFYYQHLEKSEQTIYHAIKTGVTALEDHFLVPYADPARISMIFFLVRLDCPEIFYAVTVKLRKWPQSDNLEILPEYLFDKKTIRQQQKAMSARVEKLARAVSTKTELEKELYIHDFICENIHYDKLKKPYSHEIIGPLGHGVGVCEGIAKSVKVLCDALGIWCIIVISEANPKKKIKYRHAWNIVKIGKKKMAAIGYIGAAISLILIFIIGKTAGYTNIPLLLGLHCAYGFFCFSFPIPMAMVPDAINYQEDRTGVRSDGISYATVSLSTKFGSAFGVSGALLIMGATGYIANAQQTAAALNGINVTVNLIFGIMYLCCLIPLAMYPLNEKKSGEIIENLQKKRAQRDEK